MAAKNGSPFLYATGAVHFGEGAYCLKNIYIYFAKTEGIVRAAAATATCVAYVVSMRDDCNCAGGLKTHRGERDTPRRTLPTNECGMLHTFAITELNDFIWEKASGHASDADC